MQTNNTTFCATSNGWRPIPTRLLECRGLYSPPRPVHLREVQGEGPAAGSDDIFAEMATVAADSALEPPQKLAKLRKLIADAEKSLNAEPGNGVKMAESRQSHQQAESTDNFIRRLKGRPASTPETRKSILTRLIGARAAVQRINESKKKGN